MPANKLKQFLESNAVALETIPHTPTFTSCETAAATHVHGDELAKVVMVKIDGRMAMAVVPATRRLKIERLADAAHAHRTTFIISEEEFEKAFPDCEPGAMPPFGNLYDMDVYVDKPLADVHQIAFNAGTHREVIRMNYADFHRLVEPKVMSLSE